MLINACAWRTDRRLWHIGLSVPATPPGRSACCTGLWWKKGADRKSTAGKRVFTAVAEPSRLSGRIPACLEIKMLP